VKSRGHLNVIPTAVLAIGNKGAGKREGTEKVLQPLLLPVARKSTVVDDVLGLAG
jgi:hypothetical protein